MGIAFSYSNNRYPYYFGRPNDSRYNQAHQNMWFYMPRRWQIRYMNGEIETIREMGFTTPRAQPHPPRENPSGYPEELFLDLQNPSDFECSICYCVLKNSRKCTKGHRFCYSCIYKWVYECGEEGTCPICRTRSDYEVDTETISCLAKKAVQCRDKTNDIECNWQGPLSEFDEHVHKQYPDEDNQLRLMRTSDYATLHPEATELRPSPPLLASRAARRTSGMPNLPSRPQNAMPKDSLTPRAPVSGIPRLPAVNRASNVVSGAATARDPQSYTRAATPRSRPPSAATARPLTAHTES